jgi:hypothetical protein
MARPGVAPHADPSPRQRLPQRRFLGRNDYGRTWVWGVRFQLTGRKSYGHAESIEVPKAAFRAECLAFKGRTGRVRPTATSHVMMRK